jgi:hypothetical protein
MLNLPHALPERVGPECGTDASVRAMSMAERPRFLILVKESRADAGAVWVFPIWAAEG